MPLRSGLARSAAVLGVVLVVLATRPAGAQQINEFVANHTGNDVLEFVEVLGSPSTDLSGYWILQLEGDAGSNDGQIDAAWQLGSSDQDGFWWSGFRDNQLDNGAMTLLLVAGFTGQAGDDLDGDDDGVLDVTPWTAVVDGVAVATGAAGERTYWVTVLMAGFDGVSYLPGGASRIPDGEAAWMRNDFDGAGLPGLSGTLVAGEAANTPGFANSTTLPPPPPPRLSEVVAGDASGHDHEYVELMGQPGGDYGALRVVLLTGDPGDCGTVAAVLVPGAADNAGIWWSGYLSTVLSGTETFLVVEGFSGSAGADLDADDDGTLDAAPWSGVVDGLSLSDGGPGGCTYAATVIGPGFDGVAAAPAGASRWPLIAASGTAADWLRNDFDGAGLPGLDGTLRGGEALNTPGKVNLPALATYYAGVDTSSAPALRATLHAAIADHVRYPYSDAGTDTWDILELADQDPADPDSILDVYRNATYTKTGGGNAYYNREHTWPNSYGFPDDGPGNDPYTDCHHLFLADIGYNSDRGNLPYGTCDAVCTERVTLFNHGVGGGAGTYPGASNWFTSGIWETWSERRGDVARALLYLDVRYEGGINALSGAAEPDLELTDDVGLVVTTGGNADHAYMGRLATLLEWSREDPPDARERRRNEVVASFQGNRNPFTDHPEWAECVFAGDCSAVFADGFETGDLQAWN